MTAREFLEWAGYEASEANLYRLTEYVAGDIDYSQFPDAEVVTQDGTPLNECADEPAQFQEWMDGFYQINNREEQKMRFELFIPGRDLYVFEASSYEEAVDRFEQELWDAGLLADDDILTATDMGIAVGGLADSLERQGFLRYDDAFVAEVEEDSRF